MGIIRKVREKLRVKENIRTLKTGKGYIVLDQGITLSVFERVSSVSGGEGGEVTGLSPSELRVVH